MPSGIIYLYQVLEEFCFLLFKTQYLSLPTEKKLGGNEERRRTDAAYEVMESRMPERNSEVGQSKTL